MKKYRKIRRLILAVAIVVLCVHSVSAREYEYDEVRDPATYSYPYFDDYPGVANRYYDKQGLIYEYFPKQRFVSWYDDYHALYADEHFVLDFYNSDYDSSENANQGEWIIPDDFYGIPVLVVDMETKNIGSLGSMPDIKSVKFGKNVRYVASMPQLGSVESLTFPKSLEYVYADFKSDRLKRVTFRGKPAGVGPGFLETKWVKNNRKKGKSTICNKVLIDAAGMSGDVKVNGKTTYCIASQAFSHNAKIRSLTIDGVKHLSSNTLYNSSIKKLVLKNMKNLRTSVYKDADRASLFRKLDKLESVTLKNTKITTEDEFGLCKKLKKVVFGKGCTYVAREMFSRCENLEKVYFQDQRKIVFGDGHGIRPFYECKKLKDVYFKSAEVDESIGAVFSKKTTLHVPASAVKKYREASDCKVVAWSR